MVIAVDSKNPFAEQAFAPFGEVRVLSSAEMTADRLRDVDVAIVRSETPVDAGLLEGTQVRFVGTATSGTDHVDTRYLLKKKIGFAFAPGSNANAVAEYVLSALLVLSTRSRRPLRDMSLGIVGFGNVGSRVARMGAIVGMKVVCHDPPLERSGEHGFEPLDALMSCDIVSIHVPLTYDGIDPTYHLFDRDRIGAMKRGAILINTSRGPVVDGRALVDSLSEHRLSGAVIDVWEGEPSIDTRLLACTTIATPHIAGHSIDGKVNAVRMMVRALGNYVGIDVGNPDLLKQDSLNLPTIVVPRSDDSTLEHRLLAIARQCYDLEKDDAGLRGILHVPDAARPDYFRMLRSNYPTRYEFCNHRVEISREEGWLRSVIADLGFRISD